MSRQTEWLFEVPVVSEATLYTNLYSHPEWETEWELWESPYNAPCVCDPDCPKCERKQPPWAAKPDYIIHHFKFSSTDFCDRRSDGAIRVCATQIISTWPGSNPNPNSIVSVFLTGHTDKIGWNNASNMSLSRARSKKVLDQLQDEIRRMGRPDLLSPEKIHFDLVGKAYTETFYGNNALDETPEGRSCNRRVQIFLMRLGGNLPPQVALRSGSRGPLVRRLQISLNRWLSKMPRLGLPLLKVDGIYGSRTVSAVQAFQRSKRLIGDGIVSSQTWRQLSNPSREVEFEGSQQTIKCGKHKCYPHVVKFIESHSGDAQQIASKLNVPVENILGLAGSESGWGKGRFAKEGKNFFSIHGDGPNGHMLAKNKTRVAKFNTFLESGEAFEGRYGGLVRGTTDPQSFAQSLVPRFNPGKAPSGNPNFVKDVKCAIELVTFHQQKCT